MLGFSFAVSWFSITYFGLALGKLPGLRLERTSIALVGAILCLVTGVLTFEQAIEAVDHETLALLFAMMVLVGYLRLAGFFERLADWVLGRLHRPYPLLLTTILLSGVLSAFLVNDVVCVALAPLVLCMTRRLGLKPVPYLIGLATAANIGSTATITGNPQNMIIGSLSHISYVHFALVLGPVALVGLLANFGLVAWVYRRQLIAASQVAHEASPGRSRNGQGQALENRRLRLGLVVLLLTIVLFFTGLPIVVVALGAAAVLLVTGVRPERIYRQVDWNLLVMFAGLFIVVRAFEIEVIRPLGLDQWELLQRDPVGMLSLVSAGLSNLVSNVPAVLLFKPVIAGMAQAAEETAWLALAMSSTLAGNLTILGSVANLIVVEAARREGVHISFSEYLKVGIPLTLLTIVLGVGWLYVLGM